MKDCLGRTPFSSLIATIICCTGVGLFCAFLYQALNITLRGIFEGLFLFPVPWLESVQIVFIIIAVAMGCFSVILLMFGFLATGATRQNIYSGAKCIMGGRISAAFFMGLTYVLNIVWVGVTSTCALPILAYVMLNSICVEEIQERPPWYFDNYYCLNLSRFGIYKNATENVVKNALCDSDELGQFCQRVQDAGPYYGIAFAGSLLIVLAMIMSLTAMATNYARLTTTKELTEYKQAIALETDTDMTDMGI